jgi:hypothetical protein
VHFCVAIFKLKIILAFFKTLFNATLTHWNIFYNFRFSYLKFQTKIKMNSILARAGSSLVKNAFRCPNSIRALSTLNTRILVNSLSKNDHISNISKCTLDSSKASISMSRRFYSSEKFTSSQIEEKVLEIIRNFDRVKENPAKPEVRPIFLL